MPKNNKKDCKQINLALQGGGAHGAFSWGVLDAMLEDERLDIEGLSSTSAGTVNAVAFATGRMEGGREGAREKLHEVWKAISDAGVFYSPVKQNPMEAFGNFFNGENSLWNMDNSAAYHAFDAMTRVFSPYQFNPMNFNPLRDILNQHIDFEKMVACDCVKLFVSATNARTGKVKIFNTNEVNIDVVMAASCLPFLFQAVEIGGEAYWDGGYMGNPALYPFFYHTDSRDVVVLHLNPIERDDVPKDAVGIMNRVNEISFNSALLKEFRAVAFVTKLLEDGWLKEEYQDKLKHVLIHSIRADCALKDLSVASKFNTNWQFLTTLRDRGRETAKDWIAENYKHIGKKATVDLRAEFLER